MSTDQAIFYMTEGDEQPDFIVQYEADNADLSQFSSIVLRMRRKGGDVITKTAIIDDEPNGVFHFKWADGDIIAGRNKVEIVFTHTSGDTEIWPSRGAIIFVVREAV